MLVQGEENGCIIYFCFCLKVLTTWNVDLFQALFCCCTIFTCCCCFCCCCFCCGKCKSSEPDYPYMDPEDLEAELSEQEAGKGLTRLSSWLHSCSAIKDGGRPAENTVFFLKLGLKIKFKAKVVLLYNSDPMLIYIFFVPTTNLFYLLLYNIKSTNLFLYLISDPFFLDAKE